VNVFGVQRGKNDHAETEFTVLHPKYKDLFMAKRSLGAQKTTARHWASAGFSGGWAD
jgi:hypothetical protein